MAFQDAIDALNDLNGKRSGQLIRAEEDWNALVQQVVNMGQGLKTEMEAQMNQGLLALEGRVNGRLDALETDLVSRLETLETHVGPAGSTDTSNLTGKVAALEGIPEDLQPLLENRRVTLQTQSIDHLIGEVAEITATVAMLDGTPATDRPWVDFICTWGTVDASTDFQVRIGSSGQAVSVRTNSEGIARVRVRAQQAVHLSDADESQLNAFFQTALSSSNGSIQQAMLQSSSTNGPTARMAYSEMHIAYQNSGSFQLLADNYYIENNLGLVWDRWRGGNWQDYRSTVLAFVKRDSDPTTADFTLGSSSIQIKFRDWIGPWIADYGLIETVPFVNRFREIIDYAMRENEIVPAIEGIRQHIDEVINEGNIIDRGKYLGAAWQAADSVSTTGLPEYADGMVQQVKLALQTQQSLDLLQFADQTGSAGNANRSMFGAVMDQAAGITGLNQTVSQSMGSLNEALEALDGEIGSRVVAVEANMEGVSSLVAGLGNKVLLLNSRADASEVAGNLIQSSLVNIENQVSGINVLDNNSVTGRLEIINAQLGVIHTNLSL